MKLLWGIFLTLALIETFGCTQGPQGVTGNNGLGCTITTIQPESSAPNGGVLVTCGETQTNALILNGNNGAHGTSISAVQFCSGVVSSYPTTFPEVGFCIEGNLYAVYSANDGFLTEIIPGAYNSNAVGSSCNFIVSSNCAISY